MDSSVLLGLIVVGSIAAIYLYTLFCWVLYVAAMNFARVEKSGVAIHPFVRFNARLVWFAALPVDAALNVLWSFLFLDIPRELILSPKLKRLKVKGGWRGKVATWVCRYVLNPFDPDGHHC